MIYFDFALCIILVDFFLIVIEKREKKKKEEKIKKRKERVHIFIRRILRSSEKIKKNPRNFTSYRSCHSLPPRRS